MTRSEPQGLREVHEIRERQHEERKNWTRAQLREHYTRVGEELARKHGLKVMPHKDRHAKRKAG
jgi:hypothetical protein